NQRYRGCGNGWSFCSPWC
ncbi:ribose 5-phosphate isomerase A, partial [Vibrio parahaemolyticus EKP-028]